MLNTCYSPVFLAGIHVFKSFSDKLPANRVFHNFNHTLNVVRGIQDIANHEQLTEEEREILLLAAWFHDSGHIITYQGHEEASMQLAQEWLELKNYPPQRIPIVLACIKATQLPQQPKNLLEKIICDADLYHLSLSEYYHIQFQLREEIHSVFGKEYSDLEWMEENLKFIRQHHYWTTYGRSVLTKLKQQNVQICEQLYRTVQEKTEVE